MCCHSAELFSSLDMAGSLVTLTTAAAAAAEVGLKTERSRKKEIQCEEKEEPRGGQDPLLLLLPQPSWKRVVNIKEERGTL